MTLSRRLLEPGAVVTLALLAAAWVFLASHAGAYTGTPAGWLWLLAMTGLLIPVALLTLGFRDHHSALAALVVQLTFVFLISLPEAPFLPLRYLLHAALVSQAATVLPLRWTITVALVISGEFIAVQTLIPGMSLPSPGWMVTLVVLLSLTIHGALLHLVATYARNLAQMEDRIDQLHTSVLQLTNANTEFLQQANTASEESAASERHRITRELHDVVGQTLTNIIMMMDATLHRKVHEPEETVKLLRWIRQQAKNGLQETRAVLYELRALRTQRLRGLKFLKKLVDTFTRLSGITTRVQWGNLPWAFDPEQELAVYHVLQGSLSNAFRHGTASVIEIQFQVSQGQLNLSVRDNGKGGSDSAPGIGQRSMEERLAPWGGTVSFHNEPFGYQVVANLPLQEEPGEPVQDSHR